MVESRLLPGRRRLRRESADDTDEQFGRLNDDEDAVAAAPGHGAQRRRRTIVVESSDDDVERFEELEDDDLPLPALAARLHARGLAAEKQRRELADREAERHVLADRERERERYALAEKEAEMIDSRHIRDDKQPCRDWLRDIWQPSEIVERRDGVRASLHDLFPATAGRFEITAPTRTTVSSLVDS